MKLKRRILWFIWAATTFTENGYHAELGVPDGTDFVRIMQGRETLYAACTVLEKPE